MICEGEDPAAAVEKILTFFQTPKIFFTPFPKTAKAGYGPSISNALWCLFSITISLATKGSLLFTPATKVKEDGKIYIPLSV